MSAEHLVSVHASATVAVLRDGTLVTAERMSAEQLVSVCAVAVGTVAVLRDGKLVAMDTPEQLIAHTKQGKLDEAIVELREVYA